MLKKKSRDKAMANASATTGHQGHNIVSLSRHKIKLKKRVLIGP